MRDFGVLDCQINQRVASMPKCFFSFLPARCFKKAERDTDIRDDMHGSDGPIPVRRHKPETWLPAQRAFYQACLAADFPADADMNHPESMGVGPIPMNNPDGIRMSTALTYLNPVRHRLNLTLKAPVLVRRLLFTGKQVTGVEVDSGGERS